jgi:hypothetical protein
VDEYSPVQHLISHRILNRALDHPNTERKGLTLNEERNVDPPYTSRESNNDLFPVPDGDSDGLYKLRRGYPRRICTCEAPSTEKRRRGPSKQRSGAKVIERGQEICRRTGWCLATHEL